MNYTICNIWNCCFKEINNSLFEKQFVNRDINLNKKIKQVKYTEQKFCDRFLKK